MQIKSIFFLFIFCIGMFAVQLNCSAEHGQSNEYPVEGLGDVVYARVGAWTSLSTVAAVSAFLTHKTLEQGLQKGLAYIPFISDERRAHLATIVSGLVIVPASTVICMKYGKLLWYFFYIIYAGERISPLLARRALNDLHVYIQHLNTIKLVQKELKSLIEQINQATSEVTKRDKETIDPFLLAALESLVTVNEQYIKEVLDNLHSYLAPDDDLLPVVLNSIKRVKSAVTSGLQEHAQAVVQHLQRPEDLGYDATLLNVLVKELIDYWQNYTIGLASGIDVALNTCQTVHAMEQFIVTVLDRPLAFI